jgi:hypothetical protein
MYHIKRLVVMHAINVESSVADAIVSSMEGSGITEHSVPLREYVVAAGAAYADYRDHQAATGVGDGSG